MRRTGYEMNREGGGSFQDLQTQECLESVILKERLSAARWAAAQRVGCRRLD